MHSVFVERHWGQWIGPREPTGRGGALSEIGYHNLTRPKSYHLKKIIR